MIFISLDQANLYFKLWKNLKSKILGKYLESLIPEPQKIQDIEEKSDINLWVWRFTSQNTF